MTELKTLRLQKKMTQQDVASRAGISLRSYISYENDEAKTNSIKYRFLYEELQKMNIVDKEHGILTIDDIREKCSLVMKNKKVEFCYLFGSYAKGKANEKSDVDLLIATNISGLKFYELTELLRNELHKNVDLLTVQQLLNNEKLLKEILKDGIKIYP